MGIKRLQWHDLDARLRDSQSRWRQGEHVSIIGPTGSGKTHLGLALLPIRQYITIFASKPRDDLLADYAKRKRYKKIKTWPPSSLDEHVLLWPPYEGPRDKLKQRVVFKSAIYDQFMAGGWTLFVDEVFYWTNMLKLTDELEAVWVQGRSIKLSLVAATQRPRGVPLLMYDQPSHLFFFRFGDENDLKRIGGIGWLDRKDIQQVVARLERYEFLYIYVPDGTMIVSKVEE